jgi:hypothetical protein
MTRTQTDAGAIALALTPAHDATGARARGVRPVGGAGSAGAH